MHIYTIFIFVYFVYYEFLYNCYHFDISKPLHSDIKIVMTLFISH